MRQAPAILLATCFPVLPIYIPVFIEQTVCAIFQVVTELLVEIWMFREERSASVISGKHCKETPLVTSYINLATLFRCLLNAWWLIILSELNNDQNLQNVSLLVQKLNVEGVVVPARVTKTHSGREIWLHSFLASVLDGAAWSASRPGRFATEITPVSHWIGDFVE